MRKIILAVIYLGMIVGATALVIGIFLHGGKFLFAYGGGFLVAVGIYLAWTDFFSRDRLKNMKKRPRDPNQLAKLIVDIAAGEVEESQQVPSGKIRSGYAGAKARSKALTPDQRKAIAKKAAAKRWKRADT